MEKSRSRIWYLMPIFLGVIGGVIAYAVLRKDDNGLAKNCLYVGIGLTILVIVIPHILEFAGIITVSDLPMT